MEFVTQAGMYSPFLQPELSLFTNPEARKTRGGDPRMSHPPCDHVWGGFHVLSKNSEKGGGN